MRVITSGRNLRRDVRAALAIPMLVVLLTGVTRLAPASAGDNSPGTATSDQRTQADEEKIDRLQREVDELRARLRALEQSAAARPASAPAGGAEPPSGAAAAPTGGAPPATVEQERKIGVLAEEVERIKSQLVLPKAKEYKSLYGFGPAASKVYQLDRGLSIGGYGEYNFQKFVSDQRGKRDQFDALRFVLYTGYKFNEWILFNSELEFEHAVIGEDTITAESGEVALEFAALDFLLWKPVNVRAGLLLVPMGFLNEIHEPPFYYGVLRPEVERRIIPTTWREGGVGIFGALAPGLDYRAYLMNSLNAEGFESNGIREARQLGNRALADDLSGVVRVDYAPVPGAKLGGSLWIGDSGQGGTFAGSKPSAFTSIWETHAQLEYRGLWLRALGAFVSIDDADVLSEGLGETIADDMFGFYAEAAYDLLPLVLSDTNQSFAPFFRYEIADTQDDVPNGLVRAPGNDLKIYQLGFSYKPHPQVVVKLDYRDFQNGNVNPKPDELNIGAGFVF